MPKFICSPIRYPGSKRKPAAKILLHAPSFTELREPFLGSGAVSFLVAQTQPAARIRGRDLDGDLVAFWRALRSAPTALAQRVREIRDVAFHWRDLKTAIKERLSASPSPLERAALYYVANRSSWNGAGIHKSFTRSAHKGSFNARAIGRLLASAPIARRIEVVEGDYEAAFREPGEGVFIFADPPYLSAVRGHLYGALHDLFDHERFGRLAATCPHPLLITLDDDPVVSEIYSGPNWHIAPLAVRYCARRNEWVTELMIANYTLAEVARKNSAAHGGESLVDLV